MGAHILDYERLAGDTNMPADSAEERLAGQTVIGVRSETGQRIALDGASADEPYANRWDTLYLRREANKSGQCTVILPGRS